MINPFDFDTRTTTSIMDELRIYRAQIYKVMGPHDDRLQVRILPYMIDVPTDELNYLPIYPPLFKGTVITGYSELEDGKEKATRVYVAATPDFTVGYILGFANEFESNTNSKFSQSYNFSQIKRYLNQRSCCPTDFEYKDIQVLINTYEDGTGGLMVFYNFRTGDLFAVNTTGSIITLQKDKIYMRVGSPSDPPGGNNPFSSITIDSGKIVIDTSVLDLRAKSIIMGHDGLYLVGTNAEIPVPVEQVSFMPIKQIAV